MIGELLDGALYPFKSLRLLWQKPRLLPLIIWPVLVNIVVMVGAEAALLPPAMRRIDQLVGDWLPFVAFLAKVALVAVLFVALGWLVLQFGVALGAPWYERLCLEVEAQRGETVRPDEIEALHAIALALRHAAARLAFSVGCGFVIWLIAFVPLIGAPIAGVAGLLLSASLTCLEVAAPALDRRRLTFSQKRAWLLRTAPRSLGLGAACLGLLAIPFLNLLVLPLCLIAGTAFYLDHPQPR